MINQILQSTKDEPCFCPKGKHCAGCKLRRALKPQVYLEQPHRLSIPIVISHFKYKKPSTINHSTGSRWPFHKTKENHDPPKISVLWTWYKKHGLHNDTIEEQKKLEKARKLKENDSLKQISKEKQNKHVLSKQEIQQRLILPTPTISAQVKKKVRQGKSISAKPKSISKSVAIKRHDRYQPISERFVNCIYRACCQFYCYLSIIFVVTFAFILFI